MPEGFPGRLSGFRAPPGQQLKHFILYSALSAQEFKAFLEILSLVAMCDQILHHARASTTFLAEKSEDTPKHNQVIMHHVKMEELARKYPFAYKFTLRTQFSTFRTCTIL